jgi:hypothetical protein
VGDGGHVVSRVEQTADARSREEELVLFAAEFLTSPFCTLFGRKFATEIPYGKNAEASNATWNGVRRFRSAKEPRNRVKPSRVGRTLFKNSRFFE